MRTVVRTLGVVATVILLCPDPASGQTDYYNTDAGRPVRIEDAYPVERYAFELQMAPLRMERSDDGAYHWEFEPEIAYGIFPATHVEVGVHLDLTDHEEGGRSLGMGGIEIAALHNLNLETRTLPAFAVAAEALLPVGAFAPDRVYPTVKAIATRTFRWMRVHVNGSYTLGPSPDITSGKDDLSRWMTGIAVDRTYPLRGALLITDIYVEEPMHPGEELGWTAEAGARYQLDPFVALDAGFGRRFTGEDPAWFVTIGAARAFGIRSLIPVPGRRP
ncbi:MAG TPA: hypothetical protein VMN39_01595 [Longimicrobiaceae bacterium]|nr:hypothetical protein [Longimicrobiaceae bacterium]